MSVDLCKWRILQRLRALLLYMNDRVLTSPLPPCPRLLPLPLREKVPVEGKGSCQLPVQASQICIWAVTWPPRTRRGT